VAEHGRSRIELYSTPWRGRYSRMLVQLDPVCDASGKVCAVHASGIGVGGDPTMGSEDDLLVPLLLGGVLTHRRTAYLFGDDYAPIEGSSYAVEPRARRTRRVDTDARDRLAARLAPGFDLSNACWLVWDVSDGLVVTNKAVTMSVRSVGSGVKAFHGALGAGFTRALTDHVERAIDEGRGQRFAIHCGEGRLAMLQLAPIRRYASAQVSGVEMQCMNVTLQSDLIGDAPLSGVSECEVAWELAPMTSGYSVSYEARRRIERFEHDDRVIWERIGVPIAHEIAA
jgi:hypothetical protein